ncbi:uncharacterized protein DNG_02792 [Cephalotrichum gorgonifer]|uniref:Alpha/beta hydrolase fold-3 domain-containing protein n=1 Tax=Cephalotrichum gorgonifer TaxID=2041049 RepID=A0AAE8STL5_9PEZI|nr:uncharacterized protein DNG_02792 [Cephalotrichum gorgonifer]
MEPYTVDMGSQHPNSVRLFDQFRTFRTIYKVIDGQPIHTFFIVPNELPPGPRPLLVRFHGGGLVEGEAEASMRPFFLELALKHGAVILTPDYRLRPEHEAMEVLEDLQSFWHWIEAGSAQSVFNISLPDITINAENLMVAGESGGGYLAVQTALLGMTQLQIRVLFLQYPTLDLTKYLRLDNISEEMLNCILWADLVPYSEVEEVLNGPDKGKLRTRAPFESRMRLFQALIQAGKFCDLEKDGEVVDPMRALEHAGPLPPILLYHSKEDEALPWQQTEEWAAKLKTLQPDVPLYLTFQKGSHVFDANDTMATPWLKEPLEFVGKYWPA